VKDNHTRYMRRCSEGSVDKYIVYPIDVPLDVNDTATELVGGKGKSDLQRSSPNREAIKVN